MEIVAGINQNYQHSLHLFALSFVWDLTSNGFISAGKRSPITSSEPPPVSLAGLTALSESLAAMQATDSVGMWHYVTILAAIAFLNFSPTHAFECCVVPGTTRVSVGSCAVSAAHCSKSRCHEVQSDSQENSRFCVKTFTYIYIYIFTHNKVHCVDVPSAGHHAVQESSERLERCVGLDSLCDVEKRSDNTKIDIKQNIVDCKTSKKQRKTIDQLTTDKCKKNVKQM